MSVSESSVRLFSIFETTFLFKYGKLPSRAKQLQENEFTLLLVLHTYLYIVIIWMTVSSQYRKCWTISKDWLFHPSFLMIKWRVFFFNRNIVGFCTKAVISVLINDKGANKVKELVERIQKDGRILGEGVLKVDSFVTHQVDPVLMEQMGKRFAEVFKEQGITKVVTIEASGIAPALFAARELDVPMIFARKAKSLTMDEELLTASVYSFTKQVTSTISISRKFLSSEDKVLIIDDFLANGQAAKGLIELCQQAGAQVEGIGIVIEKSFQDGRQLLEEMGLRVVSLARIASLTNGQVEFLEEDA